MKIYHNPRCSKSRQTLSIIEEAGAPVEIVEYLKEPLSKDELGQLIAFLGIKPLDLIRKNESDFKEHFKGKTLSDDEWISAMINYPKLMERPIVVKDGEAIIGRPPELVKALL